MNPSVPIDASQAGATPVSNALLDAQRCQVVGVNQNYASSSGTQYHIQIEDRGPVLDRVTETLVRRVNLIIYANYGEPNAHILYGHDYDWDDVRTADYNRLIEERVKELAAAARVIIEEKEERQIVRIKHFIRRYYRTRDEGAKREFELANALFPFLFSRAWAELKRERDARQSQARAADQQSPLEALLSEEPAAEAEVAAEEVQYPLDPDLREYVIEIERVLTDIGAGLEELRTRGAADDILLQTCRKLEERAREILAGRETEVTTRRLESMRQTLLTTWKQIQSRLRAQ